MFNNNLVLQYGNGIGNKILTLPLSYRVHCVVAAVEDTDDGAIAGISVEAFNVGNLYVRCAYGQKFYNFKFYYFAVCFYTT